MLNPTTPFLVRDGWPGKAPYVVATYDWGKEVRKELPKDEAQIDATVREADNKEGEDRGWGRCGMSRCDICDGWTHKPPFPSITA